MKFLEYISLVVTGIVTIIMVYSIFGFIKNIRESSVHRQSTRISDENIAVVQTMLDEDDEEKQIDDDADMARDKSDADIARVMSERGGYYVDYEDFGDHVALMDDDLDDDKDDEKGTHDI